MSETHRREQQLEARIRELEAEVKRLRSSVFTPRGGSTVQVPEAFQPLFNDAQATVGEYFGDFIADPSAGTIEVAGERYVLIRAAALSFGFLSAIRSLYSDRGDEEARHIGKTLLFDMAHVIGIHDARNFHRRMGVTDPIAKLSAGPVHFAYTGWAYVELLPECSPTPDDDFFLTYNHPFSFESDSWIRAGKKPDFTVCVMNAGYSSGWCEESFGLPLSATEIACKAKGDEHCTFVMAPPHRLRHHVERTMVDASAEERRRIVYSIPTLFERKEAEEQLRTALKQAEAANVAKSQFLANVSHEIRTPLTGMLGMADLLLRQDLDATQKQYVRTIDHSSRALLNILNDILDSSKIEAGMMTVTPAPCDVRAILGAIADVLRPKVDEKDLSFTVDVDDSVPRNVMADPMRLRQVVLNLAGNAVKFTEHGRVAIRASWSAPESLRLEIEDTGIGIDEADLSRLFEAFTQADTSHIRRYPGTGLGLNIAQRLVHLMGGRIDARSDKSRGSTFSFEVPAPATNGHIDKEEGEALSVRRFGAHVLVVEDDRIARYVVERLLDEAGCTSDVAADGREALAAMDSGNYDLILMDCQMPVMDGYTATRRIRELEGEQGRTPIVAMTASVLQADSERCTACGMDDFLGKPLDAARLQTVLARWVSRDATA